MSAKLSAIRVVMGVPDRTDGARTPRPGSLCGGLLLGTGLTNGRFYTQLVMRWGGTAIVSVFLVVGWLIIGVQRSRIKPRND